MKRILGTILLSSLYLNTQAYALPVLRESAGQYDSTFVTIYPDHRDPNLFYFLPNTMQFAKNPLTHTPYFSLITYGVEQKVISQAGGWMTFVFQAALTPDVQAALNSFKKDHPGASLTTMPIGESYLTVSNRKDGVPSTSGGKYFESWDLPPFGGVLETQVGGNGYLTGLGAKMMTSALTKGVEDLYALNYCFKVDGVTPIMDATIEIDYQKVFTHFKTSAHSGWLWWGADLSAEVKKLNESGAMTIKVHGDTKFEDMVLEMARQFAKEYLTPTLDNPIGNGSNFDLPFRFMRFGFNSSSVEERKTVKFNIQKQADITDARCITAPFADLAPYMDKIMVNTPL